MKQKKDKEKKKKAEVVDDGRVVVDMNVEGFGWYRKNRTKTKKENPDNPTKRELFAMILAAYKAYLPYFLILVGVLIAVFIIGILILK